MEESQIGEAVEIRVEGDEPAVPIDSQSSQEDPSRPVAAPWGTAFVRGMHLFILRERA